MSVYSFNRGIGWASSGVEYAQSYRAHVFRAMGIDAKFVFTDMFPYENLIHFTRNLGFDDDQIVWLYTYFSDIALGPTTFSLDDLEATFGHVPSEVAQVSPKERRYSFASQNSYVRAYLVSDGPSFVQRTETVVGGKLIRQDHYASTRVFSEFYSPKDQRAKAYLRRFYNADGTVAMEEFLDEKTSLFKIGTMIIDGKERLIAHMARSMDICETDTVLIDRAVDIGQALYNELSHARLCVVVHAEHYSESATDDDYIRWNNFYEYQFDNAHLLHAVICSTQAQASLLSEQFQHYAHSNVPVVAIPVGSIDELKRPTAPRKKHGLITASRLAGEKNIDWLIRAVVKVRESVRDVTLDIYGEGVERNNLASLIDNLDASEYIHLKGHHDLSDVYERYEAYISGSQSEGFGLTLLEAVGSGLAMVGFDVHYGNQTFISHGENGYLIPFDPDETDKLIDGLASSVISLFTRDDLEAFHEKSYEIASDFMTEHVQAAWGELIGKGRG